MRLEDVIAEALGDWRLSLDEGVIGGPTLPEAIAAAVRAWVLADAQVELATMPPFEGCCCNNDWRGRACQYHEGWGDGADAALRALFGEEGR